MNVKYFVVSLPRSGTTSISKMARICGLNPKHAPHLYWKNHLFNNIFNFFSDTPVYSPKVVETLCKDKTFEHKFIYLDRDFDKIFLSWKRMNLFSNYESMYGDEKNFDFVSYDESFQNIKLTEDNYKEIFSNHKNIIFDIINNNKKNLLVYNFSDGWEPFCNFIGTSVPNEEIPKLNTNSFFDPY